jgi:integrase
VSVQRTVSYDVRFRAIRKYQGKARTTYTVRWSVGDRAWQKTFLTAKLADGHRSMLLSATRSGEGFDVATGLPVSMTQTKSEVTWLEHAVEYLAMKWPDAAPKYRKSLAESLTYITVSLLRDDDGRRPPRTELRRALFGWIFTHPDSAEKPPEEMRKTVTWLRTHSRPIADLAEPDVIRASFEVLSTTLSGGRAADSTVARRRSAFHNCLAYAVERRRLASNPLDEVRRKRLPPAPAIDRRRVANPAQARALLAAVRATDPELEGFFAIMYYAGPRPAEVLNLRRQDCTLPSSGWGQLLLTSSYQRAGSTWTGSNQAGEERQLKHRAAGDTRLVPAHPTLVDTLNRHVERFDLGVDGRLFVARTGRAGRPISGPYAKPVSMNTVYRAWQRARRTVLTPAEVDSMLARRPYDLRHACLSTWLNAGVAPTQVAEWAGHSVAVLLSVYAKCLDGQDQVAFRRIEGALGAPEADQ